MAGTWKLMRGTDLCYGDLVRLRLSYDGETDEVRNGDTWADGMPEIQERWYVEYGRKGWMTLHRERLAYGVFTETGESVKKRAGSWLVLVALAPGDDRT